MTSSPTAPFTARSPRPVPSRLGLGAIALGLVALAPSPLVAGPLGALGGSPEIGAVQKRGTVRSLGGQTITVGGQARAIGTVANEVLTGHRTTVAELQGARAGLTADPVTTEEVIETTDATVFVGTTTVTVSDPAKLRAASPRFAGYRKNAAGPSSFDMSAWSAEQRAAWEAFKKGLDGKPSSHPLKAAKAGGDQTLLAAVAAGKGDLTITTRVVLPKRSLKAADGSFRLPQVGDAGFDYREGTQKAFQPKYVKLPTTSTGTKTSKLEDIPLPATGSSTGTSTLTKDFLTGFTEGDSFEEEVEWDFGVGFVRVTAGAGYAFGLRVPVQATVKLTPYSIKRTASADVAAMVETTVTPKVLNASASYYKGVGLSDAEAYDGKELVVEADVYVRVRVDALGKTLVNERIPKDPLIDWGDHFTPPFGDCTTCGVDLWIPANVTRTNISLLGIVSGSAQIGFKVSGSSDVKLDYESWFDGDNKTSNLDGRIGSKHALSWSSPTGIKLTTTLPALTSPGVKSFGYRLSNPGYDWKLTLSPGVKGTIAVKAKPLIDDELVIGPFWLDALAIPLGKISLGGHAGTTTTYTTVPGKKQWKTAELTPVPGPMTPGTGTSPAPLPAGDASRTGPRRRAN